MEVGEKGRSKAIPPHCNYLRQRGYVLLRICLSVCNFTLKPLIGSWWDFYQKCILGRGSHRYILEVSSDLVPALGVFEGNFIIVGPGEFQRILPITQTVVDKVLRNFLKGAWDMSRWQQTFLFGADPEHDPDPEIFNVILPLRAVVKVVTWSQVGANPIPIPHQLIWRYLGIK